MECQSNFKKYKDFDPDAHIIQNGKLDMAGVCPILYLFSDVDKLTFGHVTRTLIKKQLKEGKGRIESHNFKDSPHCAHYRKYPEKYEQLVKEFMDSI